MASAHLLETGPEMRSMAGRQQPVQFGMRRSEEFGSFIRIDDDERQPVSRRQLSGYRTVGCDHGRGLRIAAGRMAVGHEQDRLPIRGDLNGSADHGIGDDIG